MRVALLANLRFLSGQVMGKVTNQIIYLPDARDAPDGTIKRHHEIYLGDPRKIESSKIKTVLRHPVKLKIMSIISIAKPASKLSTHYIENPNVKFYI